VEGFRFIHRQPIVLRDIDGFGHVNNAVYLTYIENARVAYLAKVFEARAIAEIRNIMASITVNFRAPAAYGEIAEVGVRVDRIGTRSFTLAHEIWNGGDRLLADATSVQVMYDYERAATIDFPQDWLALVERFEGVKRHPDGSLLPSG